MMDQQSGDHRPGKSSVPGGPGVVGDDRHAPGSESQGAETAHLAASEGRFADGVAFRIEIPSVEGPECVRTVLAESERLCVPVRRMSQGSGVTLTTDAELEEMVELASTAGVELSLFARPSAGWGTSATARSPLGAAFASAARGDAEVRACLGEIRRAAAFGVRSVLIADLGVLASFGRMRAGGDLPPDMQAKVSAMFPVSNPATAEVLVELGADTLNVQTDLDLAQIAAIRSAVEVPLDVYVEAPDNVGGFLRYLELAELVRLAAPVYLKFGLRNAPDVYPAGTHLSSLTTALSAERVRRARVGVEELARSGVDLTTSSPGAAGLAVPVHPDPARLGRYGPLSATANDASTSGGGA